MAVTRLVDLARRYGFGADAVGRLHVLLDALAREDAPTAVHDPLVGIDVHVADSLVALELAEVREARVIADIGSGAGLPGLVLAAARPQAEVVAVESVGKKCAFIAATAEAMGLGNVAVVQARAEEWRDGVGRCDVVTARALAALPVLCEYAAPLLREGGALVAWKGGVDAAEERDGRAAAVELGVAAPSVVPVEPYAGSERRSLYVFRKVAPTPSKYPRRSGMAAKKPLRAKTQA